MYNKAKSMRVQFFILLILANHLYDIMWASVVSFRRPLNSFVKWILRTMDRYSNIVSMRRCLHDNHSAGHV